MHALIKKKLEYVNHVLMDGIMDSCFFFNILYVFSVEFLVNILFIV